MNQPNEGRLLDLLEKRAVEGLGPDEMRELERLAVDDDISLDLTAAAISLAELDDVEPMPAHLRSRIETAADEYFSKPATAYMRSPYVPPARQVSVWNWLGWALAGAACIALALNIYFTRVEPRQIAGPGPTPVPSPAELTPAQKREALLAAATDIARADIAAGKEAYKPSGDIVWSDAKQIGYIRITGLPRNDPGKEQYQLWIFDENQDPKTPVDGGVFDVPADGEVVIPIKAKLAIRNPKVFAITVERPGGVVVSAQEKVAALAKVKT